MKKNLLATALIAVVLITSDMAIAQTPKPQAGLNGAGATFPGALYKSWFDHYNDVPVAYKAIGSGEGVRELQYGHVDFGASDAPMTDAQLKEATGGEVLHIPTAIGAIVIAYNLPGVGKIKLSADVLADIYLGEIDNWSDHRLVVDNSQLASVDQRIIVIYRSDGSGTTFGFTSYLSGESSSFKSRIGAATAVYWPVGGWSKGNDGVADEIQNNPYSIGYIDLNFAISHKLTYAALKNRSGHFIDPTLTSVTAAAASLGTNVPPDLRFSLIDTSGADAYPISTATWQLVYKNQTDQAKAAKIAKLLWWEIHDGQKYNQSLNYAVIPPGIRAQSETLLRSINYKGTPVLK
jgi:phosphate transport system substrate-binding protein